MRPASITTDVKIQWLQQFTSQSNWYIANNGGLIEDWNESKKWHDFTIWIITELYIEVWLHLLRDNTQWLLIKADRCYEFIWIIFNCYLPRCVNILWMNEPLIQSGVYLFNNLFPCLTSPKKWQRTWKYLWKSWYKGRKKISVTSPTPDVIDVSSPAILGPLSQPNESKNRVDPSVDR